MKKPQFKPGDRVRYNGAVGVVQRCINLSEPFDIKAQGYRYYITWQGYTQSVPENKLKLVLTKSTTYETPFLAVAYIPQDDGRSEG